MTAQDTENSSANSLKQTMTTHGVGTTEMSDQKIWEKFQRKCDRGLWDANRLLQINVKPPLQTELISERRNNASRWASFKFLTQMLDSVTEALCKLN